MRKSSLIFCIIIIYNIFFINYNVRAENMDISDNVKIEIIIDNKKIDGIVYNNSAGKSFLSMLPITIKMADYNNTEKIGKIGNNINTDNMPDYYDPNISDIAYYKPFGNICFFYKDFGSSYKLYSIGKLINGIDIFAEQKNNFEITIKRK